MDERILAEKARLGRKQVERQAPDARARRTRSRLLHHGIAADDAQRLLRDRFAQVFARPLWRLAELGPDDRVVRYLNDHMAVVDLPSGRGVMWSPEPLRGVDERGRKRPLDLALDSVGDRFVPRQQVVATEIARRAGDGVRFSGVGILMRPIVPRPDVQGRMLGNNVFYPEVAPDTDFIVAPLPAGTETFTQVRSSRSPEAFRLDFTLPQGVELRLLKDGAAGAVFLKDGNRIGVISPPSAFDSGGQDVPTSLELDGTSLIIRARHQGGDYEYPILVDPIEDFNSWQTGSSDFNNWRVNSNVVPDYFPVGAGVDRLGEGNGLYVYTLPSRDYGHHWYSEWYWQAFGSQRIFRTELSNVYHVPNTAGARNCLVHGIRAGYWQEDKPAEPGDAWIDGTRIPGGSPWINCGPVQNTYAVHCPKDCGSTAGTTHNRVVHQYRTDCCGYRSRADGIWPHIFLGGARIFYDEVPLQAPQWSGSATNDPDPGKWLNGTSDRFAITAKSIDSDTGSENNPGVGVWQYNLTIPLQDASGKVYEDVLRTPAPCKTATQLRCPASWTPTISYPTTAMPEGVNLARLESFDALTQGSKPLARPVRVDRSRPTISLGGTLHGYRVGGSQSDQTLHNEQYSLEINANDGVTNPTRDADRRSGVDTIKAELLNPDRGGTGNDCDISDASAWSLLKDFGTNPTAGDNAAWTGLKLDFRPDAFAEGDRVVRVTAADRAKNAQRRCFTIKIRRTPRTGTLPYYSLVTEGLTDRLRMSVNTANGNLLVRNTDFQLAGVGMDLVFGRSYNSFSWNEAGEFGPGWQLSLGKSVRLRERPEGDVDLHGPDGYVVRYRKTSSGYSRPDGVHATLRKTDSGGFELKWYTKGVRWRFNSNGTLELIRDDNDNTMRIEYNATNGRLHRVVNGLGPDGATRRRRVLDVTGYSPEGYIAEIHDPQLNRYYRYAYTNGRLSSATDPAGAVVRFGYDDDGRLKSITDGRGATTDITYEEGVPKFARATSFTGAPDVSGNRPRTTFDWTPATGCRDGDSAARGRRCPLLRSRDPDAADRAAPRRSGTHAGQQRFLPRSGSGHGLHRCPLAGWHRNLHPGAFFSQSRSVPAGLHAPAGRGTSAP